MSRRPGIALQRGFTLVEAIITLMIVSIAVLAITSVLSFGVSRSADGLWQAKAVGLAESYIEQIMARRFDEQTPLGGVPACSATTVACTPVGAFDDGEPRADFDDVDDFHGVDDIPALDGDGAPIPGYERYRVEVDVTYPDAAQQAELGLTQADDAKIITVTVTAPAQRPMAFRVVKANF